MHMEVRPKAPAPRSGHARPGMVQLEGGLFRMGSDRHYPEEAPAHLVRVDAFAIDETPVGTYVEIEGDAAAIHAAAARLGFTPADYVTASYRTLYVASLPAGATPGDMLFADPAS